MGEKRRERKEINRKNKKRSFGTIKNFPIKSPKSYFSTNLC
jgi:hypothetical protein